jgi:molybdopterin-guanine dinucleotide biosynthesis protein A
MGRDKASLKLGSSRMLAIIRRTAAELGCPVRTIRHDRVARCGPLGGIYTGLVTSRAEAELFLACDMPFIESALLDRIVKMHSRSGRPVFAKADERAGFPLLLLRQTATFVKDQIDRRQFSIQELASALRAELLEIPERRRSQLLNINTPDQWREAHNLWESRKKHCL